MMPITPIPRATVPAITNNRLFNLSGGGVIQPLYPLKNTGPPLPLVVGPALTANLVILFWNFAKFYAHSFGNTLPICFISFHAVTNMPDFNFLRRVTHGASGVFKENFLLLWFH